MKKCLACNESFDGKDWKCPSCNHTPQRVGGFLSFCPDSAESNKDFPDDTFERLASLEAGNFWFRSRNRLILWAFRRYFGRAHSFLEVGCGTGFVLSALESAFPGLALCGGEIYTKALNLAKTRLQRADLLQMDAGSIPFEEEFDVIGLFDVLEHIGDDETALKEIFRSLKKGGGLMLTVPQHKRLWSEIDELSCHKRRYSRDDLVKKVDVNQPGVSKHLKVLEDAGLVSKTKVAQRREVHLEAEVLDLMTAWIERYRQRAEQRYRRLDAVLARMNEEQEGQAS